MKYDKDKLKHTITKEQIYELLVDLGGEPMWQGEDIVSKTICHGGSSWKLYYYSNTQLFHCYTDCADSFDVFDLILRIMRTQGITKLSKKTGKEVQWELYDAIRFIVKYFKLDYLAEDESEEFHQSLEDWKILDGYEKNRETDKKAREITIYNDNILKYLPRPKIMPWLEEDITQQVIDYNNISFDPVNCGIVIPHYNWKNELIGIRERTLIFEEEKYGKYKPAYLNGQLYNHPLSFNLYNLNNSKQYISMYKMAIVFESEKSCLKYQSYFGIDNDISVAVCGFNLLNYQVELLINAGAREIVIALDKQFEEIGDDNWKRLTKNLYSIHSKYGAYVQISYIFDTENLLQFKSAPIDEGKDKFLYLFKERKMI